MNNEYYSSQPDLSTPSSKRTWNKGLVIGIAAALVVAELIWGVYTLNQSRNTTLSPAPATQSTTPADTTALAPRGELMFEGPGQVKEAETFQVNIVILANQPTAGADAVIKFDPKLLEVVPTAGKASIPGKVYQEYPVNSVDNKLGELTISGITSSSQTAFSGQGVLASIKFKAKTSGQTTLNFDFQSDSITDSNITSKEEIKDILTGVKGLSINIIK